MSQPAPRRDFRVVDAVVVPRRSRLRTGFHRLGLVLATLLGLLGGALVLTGIAEGGLKGLGAIAAILALAVCCAATYAASRLIAWIAAGFLGD